MPAGIIYGVNMNTSSEFGTSWFKHSTVVCIVYMTYLHLLVELQAWNIWSDLPCSKIIKKGGLWFSKVKYLCYLRAVIQFTCMLLNMFWHEGGLEQEKASALVTQFSVACVIPHNLSALNSQTLVNRMHLQNWHGLNGVKILLKVITPQ